MYEERTWTVVYAVQRQPTPHHIAVAAEHPPAAASGSDGSSPARPRHKKKGRFKKDKSKKDKKHKRRHAEKVPTFAREYRLSAVEAVDLLCAALNCCVCMSA